MPQIAIAAAVMAAAAAAKHYAVDKPAAEKKLKLAAKTQEFSPWTGLKADMTGTDSSAVGDIMNGAISGAAMGAGAQTGGATGGAMSGMFSQSSAPELGSSSGAYGSLNDARWKNSLGEYKY